MCTVVQVTKFSKYNLHPYVIGKDVKHLYPDSGGWAGQLAGGAGQSGTGDAARRGLCA